MNIGRPPYYHLHISANDLAASAPDYLIASASSTMFLRKDMLKLDGELACLPARFPLIQTLK